MAGGAGWETGRVSNKCLGGELPHQICLGIIHQAMPTCKPLSITFTCIFHLECLDYKIKPLSVTAPVFIPSAGSTTLCGGGGTTNTAMEGSGSTSMQCPPPFDGKSTWEAKRTLLLLAKRYGWTEHQKVAYLAISLRGSALTVLTNLPKGQRKDYTALSGALQNYFGNTRQAELNRAQLQGNLERRHCLS